MDAAGLVDIGYSGCPFTWTNARDDLDMIKERLDRALVNARLLETFPHTKVLHLPRTHSDHSPLIISLYDDVMQGPFPFRCKEVWIEHPNFKSFFTQNWANSQNDFLVGRQKILDNIQSWNVNVFGNLTKLKKAITG